MVYGVGRQGGPDRHDVPQTGDSADTLPSCNSRSCADIKGMLADPMTTEKFGPYPGGRPGGCGPDLVRRLIRRHPWRSGSRVRGEVKDETVGVQDINCHCPRSMGPSHPRDHDSAVQIQSLRLVFRPSQHLSVQRFSSIDLRLVLAELFDEIVFNLFVTQIVGRVILNKILDELSSVVRRSAHF